MDNKYCNKCGTVIPPEATTCTQCGTTPEQNNANKKITAIAIGVLVFIFLAGLVSYLTYFRSEQINNDVVSEVIAGGDLTEAADSLEDSLNKTTDVSLKIKILINQGYVYTSAGEIDQAIESFSKANALSEPDSLNDYITKANVADLSNDFVAAEEYYLKAVKLAPEDYQANTSMGVFYLGLIPGTEEYEDYTLALSYNLKAYDIQADNITTENIALNYFFLEDYDTAIEYYLATNLAVVPDDNFMLGLSYLMIEDTVSAKKYIRTAYDMGYELSEEYLEFINN
jgi:tetratricopeptide (TPR) repeat protein